MCCQLCVRTNSAPKMLNDDSLNDSEELISLYSSKKVTETFKARLKKIAANHHLTDALSNENREDIRTKKIKKIEDKSLTVIEQDKMDSAGNEPIEILDDLLSPTVVTDNDISLEDSIEVVTDNDISLEDSIEVITELHKRSIRRSKRLRKKREQGSYERNQTSNFNLGIPTEKKSIQSRNKNYKEKKNRKPKPLEVILDDSSPEATETYDELNPQLSVKVIWKSVNIKKFQIRKFQKLSYIFELLSKEENISEDKIILTFNNVRVSRDDTPDTLNLQVYHFLDGGVLSESSNSYKILDSQKPDSNNDYVSLKFQDINRKIIILNLSKNEKLKIGMIKCSEQLEIPLNKIRFYCDGELLEPSDTPASLGLQNEEVIDLKICS